MSSKARDATESFVKDCNSFRKEQPLQAKRQSLLKPRTSVVHQTEPSTKPVTFLTSAYTTEDDRRSDKLGKPATDS